MAIYHLSAKLLTRTAGHNAVAAAAYRSGSRFKCNRTGTVHNFRRKTEVQHSAILAPANSPSWVHDRNTLWNQVEDSEKRVNAQLAREFVVAIPVEIPTSSRVTLLNDFIEDAFVSMGMIADYAIHDKPGNPHAHIMLTLRELDTEKQTFGAKRRDWNNPALMEIWRARWADCVNQALASHNLDERIDHRSLKEQGIARPATIHVGRDDGINTHTIEGRKVFNAFAMAQKELQRIKDEEHAIQAKLHQLRSEIIDLETTLAKALAERDAGIGMIPGRTDAPAKLILPGDDDFSDTNGINPRRPMQARPQHKSTTTTEDTSCSIYLFPS